jgi:predicted HAD superfamily phosphohydrolase YqeG
MAEISKQAKEFMQDDIKRLIVDLDNTIIKLKNMLKYYEEVLEALE